MGNHGTSSPSDGTQSVRDHNLKEAVSELCENDLMCQFLWRSVRGDSRKQSSGVRTCLGGPHVHRRVEGDDADVIFEMLQQLIELLLTAAAVSEDLHLVGDAPRHPRLDVLQIHSPLLQEEEEEEEAVMTQPWR